MVFLLINYAVPTKAANADISSKRLTGDIIPYIPTDFNTYFLF